MLWFDISVLIILALAAIRGYMSGVIMQLAYLIAIVLGAMFAGKLSIIIAPYLEVLVNNTWGKTITFILAFASIVVGIVLAGKMLTEALKKIKLNLPNRLAGSFFGVLKFLFIISLIINTYSLLTLVINESGRNEPNSITYPIIKKIAPTLIPLFRSYQLEINKQINT